MRLDFHIQKANYKTFFTLGYALAIVLGVVTRWPYTSVLIAMVISAAFTGFVFAVIERNKLDRLYGTLPLKRSELVLGRYLYALLFGLANVVAASLLTCVISVVTGKALVFLDLAAYLCAAFLYFCLFTSIVFPVYFRFGFSKNYLLTNVPLYVLCAVGYGFIRKGNLKDLLGAIEYFTKNPGMIWLAGIGGGLALLALSCCLSRLACRRYER
jgi:ABC-type transport system involved in multi-copper enzyme maturation permease subunit